MDSTGAESTVTAGVAGITDASGACTASEVWTSFEAWVSAGVLIFSII